MRIIKPGYEILTPISEGGIKELKLIERIARDCYQSQDKITEDGESAKRLVKMLIGKGHEAMIEHSFLSVRFVVDRGVTHEIVRHRIASFAQESTRYCNYSKGKFEGGVKFVEPPFFIKDEYYDWQMDCSRAEEIYLDLLRMGKTPQEARTVLPMSVASAITMTTNYREWRHFLKLRTAEDAHPQMREVTVPLLADLKKKIPIIFDDIEVIE